MGFQRPNHKLLVGTCSIVLLFGSVIYFSSKGKLIENAVFSVKSYTFGGGVLDGCYHVYLDVGSNVGIQGKSMKNTSTQLGAIH